MDREFIAERQKGLQNYLNVITTNHILSNCELVKKFLDPNNYSANYTGKQRALSATVLGLKRDFSLLEITYVGETPSKGEMCASVTGHYSLSNTNLIVIYCRCVEENYYFSNVCNVCLQNTEEGIPIVAQCVTNPTNIHEDAGSIPGLAQLRIQLCCEL